MATISAKSWDRYINALRKLNTKATNRMLAKINEVGTDDREALEELIRYAYGIATRYGEGASALSAEMYDALAELSGKIVPPAVPAPTASYGDVAKAVYGTNLQSKNPQVMADSIGRLVKMAGVDTMQQNALRDGAEWAWIPRGDTCAFCIMLASNGWQRASKKAIKNGHAMHIHANCDCTYAIRFNSGVDVEGYNNGKEYRDMYYGAEGSTPEERVNSIRRRFYAENKGIVGAESSKAEEFIPKASKQELEKISQDWYYNKLTNQEQGITAYFDTYNFTRDANQAQATKTLEKALGKYELDKPITTYRGVTAEEFSEMIFNYGEDGLKTAEMKGTSISEDRAKKFAESRGGWIFEYQIKPGRNGAYFDGGVPGSNEEQFVINKNVNYTVKSVNQKEKKAVIEIG